MLYPAVGLDQIVVLTERITHMRTGWWCDRNGPCSYHDLFSSFSVQSFQWDRCVRYILEYQVIIRVRLTRLRLLSQHSLPAKVLTVNLRWKLWVSNLSKMCLDCWTSGIGFHSHHLIIFIYNFPRRMFEHLTWKMFPTISKYKLYLECVSYDLRIEWKQGLEGNVKVKCHLKYDVRRPRGNILVCCSRILSNVDI